jgi:Ca2+/Na+ antiporter
MTQRAQRLVDPAAFHEKFATSFGIGKEATPKIPRWILLANCFIATCCIAANAVYIATADRVNANGLSDEARNITSWMAEVDMGNTEDAKCVADYAYFGEKCEVGGGEETASCAAKADENNQACSEVSVEQLVDSLVCESIPELNSIGVCEPVGPNTRDACEEPPHQGVFTVDEQAPKACTYVPAVSGNLATIGNCRNRADCNHRGNCINSVQCTCDGGWEGAGCTIKGSTISIAGRKIGACPSDCQVILDDLYKSCVEKAWFHDMEDDTRLPRRAEEIGCALMGMTGEGTEVEQTLFQDFSQWPTFLLHLFMMGYACFGLALVCEDFFVASLDIICEKMALPPDVAGATFMAAGSSAPELFVAAAGVFITHDPVGVGACAGSTMFNTMMIIGGSAMIAGKPVPLQWRCIARDAGTYLIATLVLLVFLLDGMISWWESVALMVIYCTYVLVCALYGKLVNCCCKPDTEVGVKVFSESAQNRKEMASQARLALGSFMSGNEQLADVQRKELYKTVEISKSQTNFLTASQARLQVDASVRGTVDSTGNSGGGNPLGSVTEGQRFDDDEEAPMYALEHSPDEMGAADDSAEHDHGLCAIPHSAAGKLVWAASFPIMLLLTFTIPNCAKHNSGKCCAGEKFFILTFVMCIAWLGIGVRPRPAPTRKRTAARIWGLGGGTVWAATERQPAAACRYMSWLRARPRSVRCSASPPASSG